MPISCSWSLGSIKSPAQCLCVFYSLRFFEEKINKLIQNKRELANLTVTDGETWLGDLSNSDLRELVRLG